MTILATTGGTKLARFHNDGFEIIFNDKPVMRFEKTGQIIIDGKIATINIAAVYGLRDLLKNLERGNVVEIEDSSEHE